MPTHDPILLYFIAIVALFLLVAVRRRMRQLKHEDPTWDAPRIRAWRDSNKERCVYCGDKETKNRDQNGDPCCMECESFLYP